MKINNLLKSFTLGFFTLVFFIFGLGLGKKASAAITVYVDGALSSNCVGNYSIENRNCTGSDGNGYQIFNSARIATINGDTIIVRGDNIDGSQLVYANMTAQNMKQYIVQKYPGDVNKPLLSFQSTENGFVFGANNSIISGISFTGGGATNYALYTTAIAEHIWNDIEIVNWSGNPIRQTNNAVITINRANVHDNGNKPLWESGTVISNFSKWIRNGDLNATASWLVSGSTITTNNNIIWGTDADGVGDAVAKISSGTWNSNNDIIGGGYKALNIHSLQRSGGNLNINNNVVAGNPWRYYEYPPISGVINSQSNVLSGYNPRFKDPGFEKAIFTFFAVDSNMSDGEIGSSSLDYYTNEFAKYDVHWTYFPDDASGFASLPKRRANIDNFLSYGNDLGLEGQASSRLDKAYPVTVSYSGGGTNPQIVVSVVDENDASLDVRVNGSSVGTPFPLDISRSSVSYKYIGDFQIPSSGIAKAIDDLVDWSCVIDDSENPINYDDAYSYNLESGIYNITTNTQIPWDMERYFFEEINRSLEDMQLIWPYNSFKSYYYPRQHPNTAANSSLVSAGIEVAFSDDTISGSYLNNIQNLLDIRNTYLTFDLVRGPGYSLLSDSEKEARIRGFIRNWASSAKTYGIWSSLEMANNLLHPTEAFTSDEIYWLVSQLKSEDVLILAAAETNDYIKTNWTNNGSGVYTKNDTAADFSLLLTSPAIDAGTSVGLTSDYAGNPIYGTPDIGAYEYQPPHTVGIDKIDIGAGARIYGDGKFRDKETTSSNLADLSITPESGNFETYESDEVRPEWMDIKNIIWENNDKQWTESSPISSLTNTLHAVGDLTPNNYYNVSVDNVLGNNIIGDNCTDGICKADSNGKIAFTYTGTYSEHTFKVQAGDNVNPTLTNNTQNKFSVETTSVNLNLTTDENSTCHYSNNSATTFDNAITFVTTGETNHSSQLINLTSGNYIYYAICRDSNNNESSYTLSFEIAPEELKEEVSSPIIKTSEGKERMKNSTIYSDEKEIKLQGEDLKLAGGIIKIYQNSKKIKTIQADSNGKWSGKIKLSSDFSGYLKVKLYNQYGTLVNEKKTKVKVDIEKPTFLSFPKNMTPVTRGKTKLTFLATDNNKVTSYKIYLGGNIYKTKTNSFLIPQKIQPGLQHLRIRAYDKAGNSTYKETFVLVR